MKGRNKSYQIKESLIRYRWEGNCFVNCLVKGCRLLGDTRLEGDKPELKIFNLETLYSPAPENEFPPALNYLVSNKYEVYVIDPDDPSIKNNWGNSLFRLVVDRKFENRNYKKEDIEQFRKHSWCIIISTLDSKKKKPHAVLIFKDRIWDPEDKDKWKSRIGIKELDDYINRKNERFLIAFGKPNRF